MKRCAVMLLFLAFFLAGCGVVISELPGNAIPPPHSFSGDWIVSGDLGTATATVHTEPNGFRVQLRGKNGEQLSMGGKLFASHGVQYILLSDGSGTQSDLVLLQVQAAGRDAIRLGALNPVRIRERLYRVGRKAVVRQRGVMDEIVLARADVESLFASRPEEAFDGGIVVYLKRAGAAAGG